MQIDNEMADKEQTMHNKSNVRDLCFFLFTFDGAFCVVCIPVQRKKTDDTEYTEYTEERKKENMKKGDPLRLPRFSSLSFH